MVTGRIFSDANGNGIQNTGEGGVGNVTVQLLNSTGTVVAFTSTPLDGQYFFSAPSAGQYRIRVLSSVTFSPQDQGIDDTVDSDVSAAGYSAIFGISPGQTVDIDAGLVSTSPPPPPVPPVSPPPPPPPGGVGSVSGWVWDDANHNGVQEMGESGFGTPVQVLLIDSNGNTVALTWTSGGMFSIGNIANGQYRIRVILPSGSAFAPPDQGSDATDSDVDSSGYSGFFTVNGGTSLDLDAGAYAV